MPSAQFPSSAAGWLVLIASSMVGLFASFFFLKLIERAV